MTIIGAGIGGLTAALALNQAGIRAIFERARELAGWAWVSTCCRTPRRSLRVGLLPALDETGIRTRRSTPPDSVRRSGTNPAVFRHDAPVQHSSRQASRQLARAALERLGSIRPHRLRVGRIRRTGGITSGPAWAPENREPVEAIGDADWMRRIHSVEGDSLSD